MRRTFLLPFALAAIALLPSPSPAQEDRGNWTITPLRRHGAASGDSVQLTLLRSENGMSSSAFALARLQGLSPAALTGSASDVRFRIVSDAGTVLFTGHVGSGTGSGEFSFTPNGTFASALHQRGVLGPLDDHDLLRLALVGTTTASVDALLATLRRYGDAMPTGVQLARFATHDVTNRVIADLGEAGLRDLSTEEIVRLVNHDIDGRVVREWRAAGYRDLRVEELIRLQNHDVTPAWARQVNDRTGSRLGVERLVRLKRDQ